MSFLIYGSNGYTGTLIAEEAKRRGLSPILAGRNREAIEAQSKAFGFPCEIVGLEDPAALDALLKKVQVVLHCAGPFARTSKPMVAACLRTGRHYLDITGEVAVFEACAARNVEAHDKGVMLLPGTGFDVVPSDCLAAHVKSRLPGATELVLAFMALGSASRGTATTAVENLHRGGLVRKDGVLVPVPFGHKTRSFNFGERSASAITIPWGDVATAFYSTQIPNIEVYSAFPLKVQRMMRLTRPFTPFLGGRWIQGLLKRRIQAGPAGPSPEQRARGKSLLFAEARDANGKTVASRLAGPEGYTLTALTALLITQKVLAGGARPGYQTPSLAFGKDLILEIDGVSRQDV